MIGSDMLLALFAGAVAGGGVLLLIASLVGWTPNCWKASTPDCSAAVTSATAGDAPVMSADHSVAVPSERFTTSSAPH